MDILIVVVSYNDSNNTMLTVQSLLGQGNIVVWDNASTDGTVGHLAKFGDSIRVMASKTNLLWSPAVNRAVEMFRTDEKAIVMSNNDITYRPNTMQLLFKAVNDDKKVGIAAPIGSGLGGMQDFAHWYGKGEKIRDPVQYASGLPVLRVATIVGASVLIPTRVWDEIGPLDETMPLGADDHDYCIRVKQAGYTIAVQQAAYITHRSHSSYRRARQSWEEWGGKSWKAFNEKWAGYYLNEEEAIKCQWGYAYQKGWDVGTGWMGETERAAEWAKR